MKKIPILLITHDRPFLLDKVLGRLLKFTDWNLFELWICDNNSTTANKKILEAFIYKNKHVNVFSQNINQIAVIQNSLIKELKKDIYIKLDDDIMVTENWYKGFLGVYERNSKNISFGSVIIPINGFGWVPFLEIINLKGEFKEIFPNIEFIQGCMEPSVWGNELVAEYIWRKCLNMDKIAEIFVQQQKCYSDFINPHRYSIGAIIFSHDFWEKMGGWKVESSFYSRNKIYLKLNKISSYLKKIRGKDEQKRIDEIIRILTSMHKSALGIEEDYLHRFSVENGYNQIITTQSIVFHFAFEPTEKHLMRNIFLDIKF